jgi:hypothetical protein
MTFPLERDIVKFGLLFQKFFDCSFRDFLDCSFRNFFVKGVTPFWGDHSRGFQELVKHEKMRTICG